MAKQDAEDPRLRQDRIEREQNNNTSMLVGVVILFLIGVIGVYLYYSSTPVPNQEMTTTTTPVSNMDMETSGAAATQATPGNAPVSGGASAPESTMPGPSESVPGTPATNDNTSQPGVSNPDAGENATTNSNGTVTPQTQPINTP